MAVKRETPEELGRNPFNLMWSESERFEIRFRKQGNNASTGETVNQ